MSLKPDIFADVPELDLYYNVIMLHLREDDKSYFYKENHNFFHINWWYKIVFEMMNSKKSKYLDNKKSMT